jgi:hypothetical protein
VASWKARYIFPGSYITVTWIPNKYWLPISILVQLFAFLSLPTGGKPNRAKKLARKVLNYWWLQTTLVKFIDHVAVEILRDHLRTFIFGGCGNILLCKFKCPVLRSGFRYDDLEVFQLASTECLNLYAFDSRADWDLFYSLQECQLCPQSSGCSSHLIHVSSRKTCFTPHRYASSARSSCLICVSSNKTWFACALLCYICSLSSVHSCIALST